MTDPREIVVVCYGNICRSPMGEALLQRALDERFGEGRFLVTSAGIGADNGNPPSQGTIKSMADRGIDVRSMRSTFLTQQVVERAWRVYCMEPYQTNFVVSMLREGRDRVMSFPEEIPDPLGSKQKAYDKVAEQIERLLPQVVEDIAAAYKAERG